MFSLLVEAHSPFVQCVAWASTPPTEGDGDSDKIVNVVATGGTDKVILLNTLGAHKCSRLSSAD